MDIESLTRLLAVVAWPLVALVALAVLPRFVQGLLPGARVKLTIAGQTIETTLPELRQLIEESTGEELSAANRDLLRRLLHEGTVKIPELQDKARRDEVRPLRNAGLVLTLPKGASLSKAEGLQLSGLGRVYLRATASS